VGLASARHCCRFDCHCHCCAKSSGVVVVVVVVVVSMVVVLMVMTYLTEQDPFPLHWVVSRLSFWRKKKTCPGFTGLIENNNKKKCC
jgi:hypothetical protein